MPGLPMDLLAKLAISACMIVRMAFICRPYAAQAPVLCGPVSTGCPPHQCQNRTCGKTPTGQRLCWAVACGGAVR